MRSSIRGLEHISLKSDLVSQTFAIILLRMNRTRFPNSIIRNAADDRVIRIRESTGLTGHRHRPFAFTCTVHTCVCGDRLCAHVSRHLPADSVSHFSSFPIGRPVRPNTRDDTGLVVIADLSRGAENACSCGHVFWMSNQLADMLSDE